ncbi:MAG: hypothetical protein P9L93_03020 [Candidatus Gorgyraea atricola]|nr:hypothetical protein [Candidatus Gorgyraea atricola]
MRLKIISLFWKKGWVSVLITACSIAYLLDFTWLKWGDLIVDVGREMYVPWQLFLGKVLYRDIHYLYGPFSPYFNAFLFKLFGANVYSLVLSGVITICAVSALIYKISRIFLDIFFSTFTVLTFLLVFAFGQYVYYGNYNFVIPYSYPAIHGMMFAFAALYCFYLSMLKDKKRYKVFYIVFLIAAFLCRIEIGLFLVLSIAILSLKELKYLIIPCASAAILYSLFFALSGSSLGKSSILDTAFANINASNPFTSWLLAGEDILGGLMDMFKGFLYYILFSIFFAAGGFILAYTLRFKKVFNRIFCSFFIGFIFTWTGFIFFRKLFVNYAAQYKSLPLISLAVLLISMWQFIRGGYSKKKLFLAVLCLFSLFLMSRMLFYVWAGHYGFYIVLPGLIIYHVFFLRILPERLKEEWSRKFFRFGYMFIFILFVISHLNISRFCYANKTLKIDSEKGTLQLVNADREKRFKELIDFLKMNTSERETLVVFPEGLGINFFSGMENPLYFNMYLPLDLARGNIVDRVISEMEDKEIDYVALTQRDTTEYGYPAFGKDYATDIMQYIRENYTLYKQFGPFPFTTREYGIALFKRKI